MYDKKFNILFTKLFFPLSSQTDKERALYLKDKLIKNSIPGFIVMNIPQDHTRSISRPSNTKRACPVDRANRMARICWATTDNTSMLIRLNSSKQPQAPVYNKEKSQGTDVNHLYQQIFLTTNSLKPAISLYIM